MYWVHENFRESLAEIHVDSCRFTMERQDPDFSERWHGPYDALDVAVEVAASLAKRTTKVCRNSVVYR